MTLPRSFWFLRHGETDWNREGMMQGWIDIPLNETGRIQARGAAALLEKLPVSLIVASPLSRAHETALIVNEALKKPVLIDERLRERRFGTLEGTRWRDLLGHERAADDPHSLFEGHGSPCPEGAEPYELFERRVMDAVRAHMDGPESLLPRNILFVAHGGVCRALSNALTGAARRTPNARPLLFEKSGAAWSVREA